MWKRLDISDLKKILSDDEANALNSLATSSLSAVNDTIDLVSDLWRGALAGRSVAVDVREHYTPSSYAYWILTHARQAVWTRFPMSPSIALDDARKAEYENALKAMQSPKAAADEPEWAYSSENPSNGLKAGSGITPQFLKLDGDLFWYGRTSAYGL